MASDEAADSMSHRAVESGSHSASSGPSAVDPQPASMTAPALDPLVVVRSRSYLAALVLAAVLGIPISAIAKGRAMPTLTAMDFPAAIAVITKRAAATHAAVEAGFPHFADMNTGEWSRSSDGNWTGGFFVGQLWLAAAADERNDLTAAAGWAERVLPRAASDTIFRGFLFWYGAAIGHQLLGHDRAGEVALEGALALASRG